MYLLTGRGVDEGRSVLVGSDFGGAQEKRVDRFGVDLDGGER